MEKNEHLSALSQISERLNSVKAINSLLEEVIDIAMAHLSAERGALILQEDDRLQVEISRNISREKIADLTAISTSIVNRVLQTGQPVLTIDAVQDRRFAGAESIAVHGIRSVICIPLRLKNRQIGAIYMDSRTNRARFNQECLEFLVAFGHQAAIAIENARLYEALLKENVRLHHEVERLSGFGEMIGRSSQMQAVFDLIEKVTAVDTTILIEGESGTGKELVARAIHFGSQRKDKPFIAQFCGALPEHLLESELFGYKKGSFTGAAKDKIGLFESANEGTFFLDEISEISLSIQTKLLRVIQEREIWRIGETRPRPIDVRLIATTNKSLAAEIKSGRFREDLFFRLNVIAIHIPPLREREEDIILLANHFLKHFAEKTGKKISFFSDSARQILDDYHWPGNVRELENAIERAVILTNQQQIQPEDLRLETAAPSFKPGRTLKEFETQLLIKTLKANSGNRTRAAKSLDVSLRWVQMRLKEYRDRTGDLSV